MFPRVAVVFVLLSGMVLLAWGAQSTDPEKLPVARVLENHVRLEKRETIHWKSITFSPDGQWLAADLEIPDDRGLKHVGMTRETREHMQVWNMKNYRVSGYTMVSSNNARQMKPRFTEDSSILYAVATENMFFDLSQTEKGAKQFKALSETTEVMIWPLTTDTPKFERMSNVPNGHFVAGHLGAGKLLAYQPNGTLLLFKETVIPAEPARVFGPRIGPRLGIQADGQPVNLAPSFGEPAQFSPDGSVLVAVAKEGAPGVMVWDVAAKKVRSRLGIPAVPAAKGAPKKGGQKKGAPKEANAPKPKITAMTTSRDGDFVAFGASGPRLTGILVYDSKSEKIIDRVGPLDGPAESLSMDAAGDRLLIVAGGKATLRLIDRKKTINLPSEGTSYSMGAISADGRMIALGGADKQMRLWVQPNDTLAQLEKKLPDAGVQHPPIAAAPLPAALAITPKQLDFYEMASVRRYLGLVLERSSQTGGERALDPLRQMVKSRASNARTLKTPQGDKIAALYDSLAEAIPAIAKAAKESRAIQFEWNKKNLEIAREKADGEHMGRLNAFLGLGLALAGSLTEKEYLRSESVGNTTVHYYREFAIFPGWAEAGVTHMFSNLLESEMRRSQYNALEKLSKNQEAKSLLEVLKVKDKAIDGVKIPWETLATGPLNWPQTKPPADLGTAQADPAKVVKWMEEEAKRFRDLSGRDDPLAMANIILLKANPPGKKLKPTQLLESAKKIQDLVPLVPTGKAYDPDRATLLGMAASLRNQAMAAENPKKPITQANQPAAVETVAMLQTALGLLPQDPSGWLREQQVIALALAGRITPALEQARKLAQSSEATGQNLVLLGRLECALGDPIRGMNHLEEAIVKRDYRNLIEVRSYPEFPKDHPRFADLTTITLNASLAEFSNIVTIRNQSPFPLHNVVFQIQSVETFNRSRAISKVATNGQLNPGESFPIPLEFPPARTTAIINGKSVKVIVGGLIASAPGQGRVEMTVKSP